MVKDPLAIQAIEQGQILAKTKGGNWREYAHEVFIRLKAVEIIMLEVARENPEAYKSMTFEERAEIAERALRIIQNKQDIAKYAGMVH